jgi:Lipid A core - O-antigen ligase and related enzymes
MAYAAETALGVAGAVAALALSQTRAAWVGAFVAGVAIIVQRRHAIRRHRAPVVATGVALAAIAVTLMVATPLGSRAASTFDLRRGTTAGRFDEWRVATRVIAEHPLVGVGPEGYRVVFPQAVDAAYVRRYGVAVYPDRAHNGVLDVTVVGGLAAGLLYAALLALAVRHAWRAMAIRDLLDVALGAAVLAYVVQQQFLFPLAELDPVLWVLVGMLVARTSRAPRCAIVRARWLFAPIAVLTCFAALYGARDVLSDRALRRAVRAPDAATALQHADAATRLRPDSIRAWYVAARLSERGGALTDVDAALDRTLQGLDRSPRDPALRVLYGELLVERAARSRLGADIETARRELDRLVAGAPHDPRLREAQVSADSLREIGSP